MGALEKQEARDRWVPAPLNGLSLDWPLSHSLTSVNGPVQVDLLLFFSLSTLTQHQLCSRELLRFQHCGLSENSPLKLTVSGTIRRCGNFFLLPALPDVELSATSPAPCLPAGCHPLCHGDNGLNLSNCRPAPVKHFPLQKLLWP